MIKRNIYYYDIVTERLNEHKNRMESCDYRDAMIKVFYKLKKEENPSKLMVDTDNGDKIFIAIDDISEKAIRFRMILCRTDALPYVENRGILESLDKYIREDQNIAEITHFIVFLEKPVVGMEFNFSGAKSRTFCEYIEHFSDEIDSIVCVPKLNMDTYSKLIDGEEFSLFDLAVKSDSKAYDAILKKKSIFKAIFMEIPDIDVMQIRLTKRKTKRNKGKGFVPPLSIDEMKELSTRYRDDIKKFRLSQKGISGDVVDLLEDKLVTCIEDIFTNNRSIDSSKIYNKIEEFYYNVVDQN